tara:strand:- start:254 stop:664 length:411 start_codon:yes stop_codon:yes gene_type:complete
MANSSYETTGKYLLQTNSTQTGDGNVALEFVRDEKNTIYIVLSSEYILEAFIKDALLIYLKDGNIILIDNAFSYDYYDGNMVSMYKLTDERISKIINADKDLVGIDSIRYTNSSRSSASTASNNNFLLGKALKEFL